MDLLRTYAKMIIGSLMVGLSAAYSALDDGSITIQEAITIVLAILGAWQLGSYVPTSARQPSKQ